MPSERPAGGRRVCLCVLMMQPLPELLPLLRTLYRERFSELTFLMPFAQVADPDVVTVYRGPYARMGYLTDARERLARIDCDYFLVLHHDVLLNPAFDEATLLERIPLGTDEGFFPSLAPLPESIGGWSRYFGLTPKLAYPRSILFGSGIEREVLRHYLPEREGAVGRLTDAGAPFRSSVQLGARGFGDVAASPSRVLLHGETASLADGSTDQALVDSLCLDVERALVSGMAAAAELEQGTPPGRGTNAEAQLALTLPVTRSALPASLYVLPRGQLDRFAHLAGVAAAANLDADMVVPTLLYLLCSRTWSASDAALNLRGMTADPDPAVLSDPRILAVEPMEPGWTRSPAEEQDFADRYRALARRRRRRATATPGEHRLGIGGTLERFAHDGWHRRESWGRWSAQTVATLRFWVPRDAEIATVRVGLVVPVHPRLGRFRGVATLNDTVAEGIDVAFPDPFAFALTFDAAHLRHGAINRVVIRSDRLVQPSGLNPPVQDRRRVGIGVSFLAFARDGHVPEAPPPTPPLPATADAMTRVAGLAMDGWHGAEDWGRWAESADATIRFTLPEDRTVEALRVRLRAPIAPSSRRDFSGWVRLNDGALHPIYKRPSDPDAEDLLFAADELRPRGTQELVFHSDRLVSSADDDPASSDPRSFGFGFMGLELITADLDPLQLPTAARAAGTERFHDFMRGQRDGGPAAPLARPGTHPAGSTAPLIFPVSGWYPPEPWGRWAAAPHATIQFWMAAEEPIGHVHLGLRAAPRADAAPATGRVRLNGGDWQAFASPADGGNVVDVYLDARNAVSGGMNWIDLVSDQLSGPMDLDPEAQDWRRMGFGLATIGFG